MIHKGLSLAYKGQSLIHMGYVAYGYYIVRKHENHVSLSSKGQSLLHRGLERVSPLNIRDYP